MELENDTTQALVTYDTSLVTSGQHYNPHELVTAEDAMKRVEFFVRDQKRAQIQLKLNKVLEPTNQHGMNIMAVELRAWLRPLISANIDRVLEMAYAGNEYSIVELPEGALGGVTFASSDTVGKRICTVFSKDSRSSANKWSTFMLNENYGLCHFIPEKDATRCKTITFTHWRQFVHILNIERKDIPLTFRNYKSRQFIPYGGNTMLSDVDPLLRLCDPASSRWESGITVGIQLNGRTDNKFKRKYGKFDESIVALDGTVHDNKSEETKSMNFYTYY